MLTTADKRAAFRKMHESGCFIIPNPFDVGSAKALAASRLQGAGFHQRRLCLDHRQGRQPRHRRRRLRSSDRDLRGGRYSRQCRFRGRLCARAGQGRRQCRARREDRRRRPFDRGFYRRQRKAAVRPCARRSSASGRRARRSMPTTAACCSPAAARRFCAGVKDLKLVIDRLTAYAEAGADCLYAPGIATAEEISAVVKAVASKARQSPGRRGRPVAEGSRRSRRAPHQRRRRAGADGLGRLHEGGKGDGGAGHVHANSPTAIPAANSTRCSARSESRKNLIAHVRPGCVPGRRSGAMIAALYF